MHSLSLLPWPLRRASLLLSPARAVGFSLGMIVVWAAWAAACNTAQFGDNVEQFNWARSLEGGYHKHPPLPSWALGLVMQLFGPSIYWAYVLATLCLVGTATFTWLIGRRLVGDRVASAALLLWGLSLNFSQRAQLYNHNTVLVLWIAAAAWFALRATAAAPRTRLLWWTATGIASAAAILSKYQALVPLAGLVVALVASRSLPSPADRRGLALAVLVTVLACVPHGVWVVRHDFSTLRYASDAVESSTLAQRSAFIVSFIANQLRLYSPVFLAIAICGAWARVWPAARAIRDARVTGYDVGFVRAWLFGLVGVGLLLLATLALGTGLNLRNHWGVQALQFLPIWLAWRWDRYSPIDLRRLVLVALAVHAAGLVGYAVEHSDRSALSSSRRIDTMYPARRLARVAVDHWARSTTCPLHYVTGSGFEAGLVSLYSGGNLVVFDTVSATPWVHPDDLRRKGALYMLEAADPIPAGVTHVIAFDLVLGNRHRPAVRTVRIGLLLPGAPCSD